MNHVKRITRWIDAHTLWAYNSRPGTAPAAADPTDPREPSLLQVRTPPSRHFCRTRPARVTARRHLRLHE